MQASSDKGSRSRFKKLILGAHLVHDVEFGMALPIFLITFIFFAFSAVAEIVVKSSSIKVVAARILKTNINYVQTEYSIDTLNNKRKITICHSEFECGQGSCTNAVFLETKTGSFEYVGLIYGVVKKLNFESKSFPSVETLSSIGAGLKEITTWIYNPIEKKYETK